MKKHFFNALCISALATVTAIAVQSCNSNDVDLETRVTVLEGMIRDLQKDLQAAMVTGSTIVTSNQSADGTWTLVLSDGNEIVIKPSTGGGAAGGSTVTVTETEEAFIINVDGKDYVLPKTASVAVNSVVYVPEYEDGMVVLGNDGASARFLVTPALTSAQVSACSARVADARELLTRAGSSLIKVTGVAADGDLLRVDLKGIAVAAGKSYTVAVRIDVDGTEISSNYFTVKVADDFSFDREQLETPSVKGSAELTTLDGALAGYHRILIPESAFKFAAGFKLSDYVEVPAGATFELAPAEDQNDNVKGHYGAISAALSADGSWKPTQRLGTDAWNSDGKNGIIIYTVVNDVIKHKIFWQIDNPIPGMGLDKLFGEGFPEAQHMEIGTEASVNAKYILPAGAQVVDIAKLFLTAQFPEGELLPDPIYLRHGNANKAIQMMQECAFADGAGEDVIYADGDHFSIGEKYQPLVARSRGIVFRTTQPSWVSSIRENWPDDAKAACNGPANGEILGGWDGGGDIPGLMGWEFNEKGLVTYDNYQGWGFRSGLGAFLEYEFGEQQIGPWHWAYVFFNRRVAPYEEGKGNDPDAR